MSAANTDLRSLLARLYPDPDEARRVVSDADLDGRHIDFSGSAELVWFRVLAEAEKHGPGALYRLRQVAWKEYPEALEEPAAPPLRPEEPLGSYLEWAWRHHRVLRVLGYQNRERIQLTLDDVFVDLSVEAGRPRPDREPLRRLHHSEHPDEAAFEQSELMNLADALRLAERRSKAGLVLLGDPGAGKTTLLKHLLCRAVAEGTEALGMPKGLVPVLLRFSQLRTGAGGNLAARGLLKVLRRELKALGYEAAGQRLGQGDLPVLFLLDGLDEVRDEATRVDVCHWLDDEVAHFSGSRFVGTCRFAAWQREARLHNQFLTAHVQWLDRNKVRAFVERWYVAVEVGQGGTVERAHERAASLLEALLGREREAEYRLREMTRNPLLLSVLCLVHYSGDSLPESRAKLYDVCISFLLETWAGQREGRPVLPDAAARQVLQPLAWAMHEQRTKTLSAQRVRAALAEPFAQVQGLGLSLEEFLRRGPHVLPNTVREATWGGGKRAASSATAGGVPQDFRRRQARPERHGHDSGIKRNRNSQCR
ncbi:MAG: NACHT domain-containing protein [Polyangiaceae bacterium]|nr:NACHT domain-containing protein [Polyangiaceae bacterium]